MVKITEMILYNTVRVHTSSFTVKLKKKNMELPQNYEYWSWLTIFGKPRVIYPPVFSFIYYYLQKTLETLLIIFRSTIMTVARAVKKWKPWHYDCEKTFSACKSSPCAFLILLALLKSSGHSSEKQWSSLRRLPGERHRATLYKTVTLCLLKCIR